MAKDDNSVNIEKPKRGYHHGDLRAALITIGLEQLKLGVEALSLREIARAAGVSATAVYRHFPSKQDLLYALCAYGAEALGAAQTKAMIKAGGGIAGFDASGKAYVRFALGNPALFRLLMSTRPPGGHFGPEDSHVSSAMRLLQENVAALLPPEANAARKRIAAMQAWALVHGMAMLMLDGQIPADEELIESIATKF